MTPRQRHLLGLAATLAAGLGALLAASGAGCSGPGPARIDGDDPAVADASEPLRTRPGEPFEIVLRSNPSTGYEWRLLSDSAGAVVRFESQTYKADGPVLIGSGGRDVWRFRAVAPGEAVVRLGQFPPGDAVPSDSVAYTIRVE